MYMIIDFQELLQNTISMNQNIFNVLQGFMDFNAIDSQIDDDDTISVLTETPSISEMSDRNAMLSSIQTPSFTDSIVQPPTALFDQSPIVEYKKGQPEIILQDNNKKTIAEMTQIDK